MSSHRCSRNDSERAGRSQNVHISQPVPFGSQQKIRGQADIKTLDQVRREKGDNYDPLKRKTRGNSLARMWKGFVRSLSRSRTDSWSRPASGVRRQSDAFVRPSRESCDESRGRRRHRRHSRQSSRHSSRRRSGDRSDVECDKFAAQRKKYDPETARASRYISPSRDNGSEAGESQQSGKSSNDSRQSGKSSNDSRKSGKSSHTDRSLHEEANRASGKSHSSGKSSVRSQGSQHPLNGQRYFDRDSGDFQQRHVNDEDFKHLHIKDGSDRIAEARSSPKAHQESVSAAIENAVGPQMAIHNPEPRRSHRNRKDSRNQRQSSIEVPRHSPRPASSIYPDDMHAKDYEENANPPVPDIPALYRNDRQQGDGGEYAAPRASQDWAERRQNASAAEAAADAAAKAYHLGKRNPYMDTVKVGETSTNKVGKSVWDTDTNFGPGFQMVATTMPRISHLPKIDIGNLAPIPQSSLEYDVKRLSMKVDRASGSSQQKHKQPGAATIMAGAPKRANRASKREIMQPPQRPPPPQQQEQLRNMRKGHDTIADFVDQYGDSSPSISTKFDRSAL